MSQQNETGATAGHDIDARATVRFLAIYLVVAFVLMAAITLVTDSLALRGLAFLVCHAVAAGVGYRVAVAPQIDALPIADFSSQVEKIAASYGLLAVLKHVLLLVFARASAWLADADQALVWMVDATYLNTSLLPDVAALGVISLTIHTIERGRQSAAGAQQAAG